MVAVTKEILWRENKYGVMYHSQRHYNDIRQLMREEASIEKVAAHIEEALRVPPTIGSRVNACQHMIGYFKKVATSEEKEQLQLLLTKRSFHLLRSYLYLLAKQYNIQYLCDTKLLQPH